MGKMDVHFSSVSETWETPVKLFKNLDKVWNFTLDPACSEQNATCSKFFTREDDGLKQDWSKDVFFLNPPYGRVLARWVKKARDSFNEGATGVCLIPSRTDTRYMHEYVYNSATAVTFIKGRLKFQNRNLPSWKEDGSHKLSSAPFPSKLVIFDKDLVQNQDKINILSKYGKLVIL